MVRDSVLVADIAGDSAADGIDFVESLGEESNPSGTLGQDFESLLGAFGMFFIPENANGIDRGPIFLLQLFYRLFQSLTAGVVLAIGDQEYDFLFEPSILL